MAQYRSICADMCGYAVRIGRCTVGDVLEVRLAVSQALLGNPLEGDSLNGCSNEAFIFDLDLSYPVLS